MLNQEQINMNWKQIKGAVRNMWGEISDDELEEVRGNFSAISGIVHRKYGETNESIKHKMDRLMESFDNTNDKFRDGSRASFERSPVDDRTSGRSQMQDYVRDVQTRGSERTSFDSDSFEAADESIHHARGTTNNSYMNPNRERIGENKRGH